MLYHLKRKTNQSRNQLASASLAVESDSFSKSIQEVGFLFVSIFWLWVVIVSIYKDLIIIIFHANLLHSNSSPFVSCYLKNSELKTQTNKNKTTKKSVLLELVTTRAVT